MRETAWCGVVALMVLGGCGDGSNGDFRSASGETPEELCAEKCALQVAAGCDRTPPNYAESCAQLCLAKYRNFPGCVADMRPLEICAIERVNYGCTDSGVVTASPTGACAREGARCANCTGDVFNCL